MDKIDIRDLRVGDWVYYDPNVFIEDEYKQTKDVEITQIHNGDDISLAIEECYSPIPLTKEILEKNGFKYKEFPEFAVNEITEKTKITITYHSGTKTIFIGISKPNFNLTSSLVLYVHEMQNLLRDARIEKEITI